MKRFSICIICHRRVAELKIVIEGLLKQKLTERPNLNFIIDPSVGGEHHLVLELMKIFE